jgi:hypothetical protein
VGVLWSNIFNVLIFIDACETNTHTHNELVALSPQDSGLLQNKDDAKQLSSSERALRHGELKVLRTLKRSFKEAGPRKRKVLKVDTWEIGEEGADEPGDIDIRDVEFRLSNDSSQVQVSGDISTLMTKFSQLHKMITTT